MKKLLYITNAIHGVGGLERVLAIKTDYLINTFNYQINILTLNAGNTTPFFKFNKQITFINVTAKGRGIRYLLNYYNGIKKAIQQLNPEIILVCDDGVKGLFFPLIFGNKIPLIYERHVSKQVAFVSDSQSYFIQLKNKLQFKLMDYLAAKFHKFVVLTQGNLKEWRINNAVVIPNPLPFKIAAKANLSTNKVIAVGKQSYQKGYDLLLQIWKIASEKYPNWNLEIIGTFDATLKLEHLAKQLNVQHSVTFLPPIQHIEDKYKEASIYVLTSRYEGFGMVLIEAMSFGVPCVAFNCPHGPSDIVVNDTTGYLVEEKDIANFAKKLTELMANANKREEMGCKGQQKAKLYEPQKVAMYWHQLFQSIG